MTVQNCTDMANGFSAWVASDYYDNVPYLIGNAFGMPDSQYRAIAIVLPVITNVGCYIILWTKSFGESRGYEEMPSPIFTKWSWTKLFAVSGVTIVPLQFVVSLLKSSYRNPSDAYSEFFAEIDRMIGWYCCDKKGCGNPVQKFIQAMDSRKVIPSFVGALDSSLQTVPAWLGGTALVTTLILGVQFFVSCVEKRRVGKRDIVATVMMVGMLFFSIYQLACKNTISFSPLIDTSYQWFQAEYT